MQPHLQAAACRHKLVLGTRDRDEAQRTATALAELLDPPADAVSIFEVPGTDSTTPQTSWRVDAYFIERPDAAVVATAIAELTGKERPGLLLEAVPDENWVTVAQAALPPVAAGRFIVHGSHDRKHVPRGPWTIEIDAGEAFGTAHHATTLGCLLAVDRLCRAHRVGQVLDLGCGTGVLAIAAKRALPRAQITASDVDPIAVQVMRANARANGATAIKAVVCDGVPRRGSRNIKRYDLLIGNILARPLISLASDITRVVARGGTLVLSGLLTSQVREVLGAYLARDFQLARHDRIAGWSTLTLVRR